MEISNETRDRVIKDLSREELEQELANRDEEDIEIKISADDSLFFSEDGGYLSMNMDDSCRLLNRTECFQIIDVLQNHVNDRRNI